MGSIKVWDGSAWQTSSQGPAQTATQTAFTPTGTIAATDVQSAIAEVATDAIAREALIAKGIVARAIPASNTSGSYTVTTTVSTANFFIASFAPDTSRAYKICSSVVTQIPAAGGSWTILYNVGGTDLTAVAGDAATATASYNPVISGHYLWLPSSSTAVDIKIKIRLNSGATPSISWFDVVGAAWGLWIEDLGAR